MENLTEAFFPLPVPVAVLVYANIIRSIRAMRLIVIKIRLPLSRSCIISSSEQAYF